jgi:hypothetical protein
MRLEVMGWMVLTMIAVLHALHPDEGDEFPLDVYLPCPARPAQGEPGHTVCELRMQRMRI